MVKDYEKQAKPKRPDSKSYQTLVKYHLDQFVPLRMEFFRYIAKILHEFLVDFQIDKPMVPFLANALETQMRRLARIILKREVLTNAKTPKMLLAIDVRKTKNQLGSEEILVPTRVKQMLSEMSSVRLEKKREFRNECLLTVVEILTKLKERSPLNSVVVRYAASLEPKDMCEAKDASVVKFNSLAEKISKYQWITCDEADTAKEQYNEFIYGDCVKFSDTISKVDHHVSRLDQFLRPYLDKPIFADLWKVCSIIFTLSHGQASIERLFSE